MMRRDPAVRRWPWEKPRRAAVRTAWSEHGLGAILDGQRRRAEYGGTGSDGRARRFGRRWPRRRGGAEILFAGSLGGSPQPLLRFEPDRQIAVGGSSVLDPEIPGALCDVVMERRGFRGCRVGDRSRSA